MQLNQYPSAQQRTERRERNKEHAKRSRIRKKFLLESLQQQVNTILVMKSNDFRIVFHTGIWFLSCALFYILSIYPSCVPPYCFSVSPSHLPSPPLSRPSACLPPPATARPLLVFLLMRSKKLCDATHCLFLLANRLSHRFAFSNPKTIKCERY